MKKQTKEQLLKEFEKLEEPKKKSENHYCNYCNSCNSCNSCLRLTNGILCKGLRFDYDDENAYNKDKY